ncbi:hypothetical protein GALL_331800 [mine drainage metagenome]|uniref:Uncharacterized protein n=1 Tax=mine drainage metagenome TaxID=410659 RepID=A0A1J5R5J1_9ZZZZ
MATANGSAVGVRPMETVRRDGARPQLNPLDALAQLLADVRVWARHQRQDDLMRTMGEAQRMLAAGRQLFAEGHHG